MNKKIFYLMLACSMLFACKDDDENNEIDNTSNNSQETPQNISQEGAPLSDDIAEYIYQKKSSKRGIGFNSISAQMAQKLGKAISWAYNWGAQCDEDVADAFDNAGIEFVPMAWNKMANYEDMENFVKAHPNTKHVLGYNEPNLTDQCNETPSQTAESWNTFINFAKNSNLSAISPAMNYGTLSGYSDPWKWLDEFYSISNINADEISGTAIHCYMADAGAQTGFAQKFEKYSKPIWVTEFAAWENSKPSTPEGQISFLTQMVNAFEQNPNIERYAWFMYDYNQSPDKYPFIGLYYNFSHIITDLGLVYFNMSSFDKDVVYPQGVWFPAEHYSACSNTTEIAVSNDPTGGNLMISGLNKGKFAEYNVYLVKGDNYLNIRYTANRESEFVVTIGDQVITEKIPADGDNWLDAKIKITSEKSGPATINISVNSGRLNINRLAISNK